MNNTDTTPSFDRLDDNRLENEAYKSYFDCRQIVNSGEAHAIHLAACLDDIHYYESEYPIFATRYAAETGVISND